MTSMFCEGIHALTGKAVRLEIRRGRIAARADLDTSEALPFISPGFLDMQINGYGGIDYSLEGFTETDIERILQALDASGTTQHTAKEAAP